MIEPSFLVTLFKPLCPKSLPEKSSDDNFCFKVKLPSSPYPYFIAVIQKKVDYINGHCYFYLEFNQTILTIMESKASNF